MGEKIQIILDCKYTRIWGEKQWNFSLNNMKIRPFLASFHKYLSTEIKKPFPLEAGAATHCTNPLIHH